MTTATICKNCTNFNFFAGSKAVSPDYQLVRRKVEEALAHLQNTVTLGQKIYNSFDRLQDIQEESRLDNWDGYEAKAVKREAIIEVEDFLRLLPSSIPEPEISAEPDGGISLEWTKNRRNVFSISFIGKNKIDYAGLFGSNEVYGVEKFIDMMPITIMDNLKRLFF